MDRKYKKKEDEFAPRRSKQDGAELQVTGVSRSGRVRKKSSKLMDFENLDEIDIRTNKKKEKSDVMMSPGEPDFGRLPKKETPRAAKEELLTDEEVMETEVPFGKSGRLSDDSDNEMGYPPHDDSSLVSMGSDMDDMDATDLDRVEAEGFQSIAGSPEYPSSAQQQSLYMTEKSSKKKLVIKDGKIVGRTKSPRKDKGQARLTAYMLWAKEIRQELTRSDPHLDFSQTSKKLGELWATVPIPEKYIWKRRAKRAAEGGGARSSPVGQSHQSPPPSLPQPPLHQLHSPENKKLKSPPIKKFPHKIGVPVKEPPAPPTNSIASLAVTSPQDTKGAPKPHNVDQTVYKAVGTTPLDVAAHIRLLGESLTIIGERLTEHEGQIAVSGSFSVLLDSLLCVLAPLMCLTQQVPQMNVIPQEQLSGLMDNIAYIMPGL